MSALAWILALVAMLAQPYTLPDQFVRGAQDRGHAVIVEGFIGVEWQCSPADDEQCYAGLRTIPRLELVTGP